MNTPKLVFILYLLMHSIIFNNYCMAQTPNYDVTSLCDLNLDRTATKLTPSLLETFSPAYKGFIWNDEDNEDINFRPQGITSIDLNCRKYICVSSYGIDSNGWENPGVRISFVDISNMDSMSYVHVLLVDENYNIFDDEMHAGGIHYLNGKLYVPDTRTDSNKRIYSFDLDNIEFVPDGDVDNFYGYTYIVKRSETYHVPIKPSCLSYDWDSEEFIIATFDKGCDNNCTYNDDSAFSWFDISSVNSSSSYNIQFFDRIQGITSLNSTTASQKMIWTSQSFGRNNPSYLYATISGKSADSNIHVTDTDKLNYTAYSLPPGLEDLHFEQDKETLWTLTEFGPNEGVNNNRAVFAFSKNDILPPGVPSEESSEDSSENLSNLKINESIETIKIYPNPNSGKFTIDIEEYTVDQVLIYDQSGKTVYNKHLKEQISKLNLNLPSGIYIIRFVSKTKFQNLKLIIT